jgi:hypothetical protein
MDRHAPRARDGDLAGPPVAAREREERGRHEGGARLVGDDRKPIDELLGKQAPDLAIDNENLKDELRELKAENDVLRAALQGVADLAARHADLLR